MYARADTKAPAAYVLRNFTFHDCRGNGSQGRLRVETLIMYWPAMSRVLALVYVRYLYRRRCERRLRGAPEMSHHSSKQIKLEPLGMFFVPAHRNRTQQELSTRRHARATIIWLIQQPRISFAL